MLVSRSAEAVDESLEAAAADAHEAVQAVKVDCTKCKHKFEESDLEKLVSKTSAEDLKLECPSCEKELAVPAEEVGCPACRRNFWVAHQLLGRAVGCPDCSYRIKMPSRGNWNKMHSDDEAFEWHVVSMNSGDELALSGLGDVISHIVDGTLRSDDVCATHPLAPWRKVRDACDEHFALQKLYDPVGAHAKRVGRVSGVTFAVLFVVTHVIGGLKLMGSTYLLSALFGILGIVLTPTIIGLVIIWFVAGAFGVPLLGAYLGVLVSLFAVALAGGIGWLLGCCAAWVTARAAGVHRRRAVDWS